MPPINKLITKKDVIKLNLDDGIYKEAKDTGKSIVELLEKEEKAKGYTPEGVSLEIDAFSRQLVAHGINPGNEAALVDKFFQTKESQILFPAYIDKQVRLGMNLGKLDLRLSDTYVASEKITSGSVVPVGLDFVKEDTKPKRVTPRAKFPRGIISEKEKSIKLIKVGRMIGFTYEAIRRMQIISASIFFQGYGFQLRKEMTEKALDVIINGDGNANSAAGSSATVGASWNYADLIDLIFQFKDGHEASHIVMNPKLLQTILTDKTNFPQFQSMNILEEYMKTGEIRDFLGMTWRTHESVDEKGIVAYEKQTCLKYYEEKGSSIVESEKIISNQIENTVISINFNFGKMFEAAAHYKQTP